MKNTIIYHVIYTDGFSPVKAIHKVAEFKWRDDAKIACDALNESLKNKEWKDRVISWNKEYYGYTEKSGAWNAQLNALIEAQNNFIERNLSK